MGRFLAYVLRHHPEDIGLTLDEYGSVDVSTLVDRLRKRPGLWSVSRERIERFVFGPGASRFEIREGRIRARYGHSLPKLVQYEPADPPPLLFHGTTPEAVAGILTEGLRPEQRQRVHLSIDVPAAREVGRRKCDEPVILQIDTETARKASVHFYKTGPSVWLADPIPPQCIRRLE